MVRYACVQLQASRPATPVQGVLYDILHLGDRIGATLGELKDDLGGALPLRADPVGDFLDSAAAAADWEPMQWDPLAALFDGALWHGNVRSKYDPVTQMVAAKVRLRLCGDSAMGPPLRVLLACCWGCVRWFSLHDGPGLCYHCCIIVKLKLWAHHYVHAYLLLWGVRVASDLLLSPTF